MKRVCGRRIDRVGPKKDEEEYQRVDPCMAEGKVFPSAEEGADFPTLGLAGHLTQGVALWTRMHISFCFTRMEYLLTGVKGGEFGSSVDNAAAPVSPLSSAPRPLDFLGRGMSS